MSKAPDAGTGKPFQSRSTKGTWGWGYQPTREQIAVIIDDMPSSPSVEDIEAAADAVLALIQKEADR